MGPEWCPECGDEWEDEDSENGVNYYSCPNGHMWSDDEDEEY